MRCINISKFIKEKYKDVSNENYNGVIPIRYLYSDKYKHDFWECKCICGKLFIARIDCVKNGNTKSCGCLKKSKPNQVYFPVNCGYGICYYNNYNGYFIFDEKDKDSILKYHWSATINRYKNGKEKRVVPTTRFNKKTITLSKFLFNTPEGFEVDHLNGNTNDFRRCNLRICTKLQNLYNRQIAAKLQGQVYLAENYKYKIEFSKEDDYAKSLEFDTFVEANNVLIELQNKHFGDFGYRKSQEIAKQIETNEFNKKIVYHDAEGILDEIFNLPKKNFFNITLNNIRRDRVNNVISELNETILLLQLISDYKQNKAEKGESV